jgi:hypothetical protein
MFLSKNTNITPKTNRHKRALHRTTLYGTRKRHTVKLLASLGKLVRLEFNGICEVLISAAAVNSSSENINTNTEAALDSRKKNGLQVNTGKICMC